MLKIAYFSLYKWRRPLVTSTKWFPDENDMGGGCINLFLRSTSTFSSGFSFDSSFSGQTFVSASVFFTPVSTDCSTESSAFFAVDIFSDIFEPDLSETTEFTSEFVSSPEISEAKNKNRHEMKWKK